MDITDCVLTSEGERERVVGFYKVGGATGRRRLLPCMPDDPEVAAVSTYAICGRFHRPWALTYRGPVSWADDAIARERADWIAAVGGSQDHLLSERDYPGLFRRVGDPLTAHEMIKHRTWMIDQYDRLSCRSEWAGRIARGLADPTFGDLVQGPIGGDAGGAAIIEGFLRLVPGDSQKIEPCLPDDPALAFLVLSPESLELGRTLPREVHAPWALRRTGWLGPDFATGAEADWRQVIDRRTWTQDTPEALASAYGDHLRFSAHERLRLAAWQRRRAQPEPSAA